METPTKRPTNKTLNVLGTAYKTAPKSTQLLFKGALMEFAERDSTDYWRQFRDLWQYTDKIGRAPFAIVATAHNVLGFSFQSLTEK